MHDAEGPVVAGDDQRRSALLGDALHDPVELGGALPPCSAMKALTASAAPLRMIVAVHVDAAHPGLRREGDEVVLAELALAQVESLLGENHDRAALGGLVGERGKLRHLGELALLHAVDREELGGLPVAEGDRAGLVEQEHVDVARCLDRASRHGEHVALHQPVHAGDADRRQQGADRRRDERDEQRDEDGLRGRCPA